MNTEILIRNTEQAVFGGIADEFDEKKLIRKSDEKKMKRMTFLDYVQVTNFMASQGFVSGHITMIHNVLRTGFKFYMNKLIVKTMRRTDLIHDSGIYRNVNDVYNIVPKRMDVHKFMYIDISFNPFVEFVYGDIKIPIYVFIFGLPELGSECFERLFGNFEPIECVNKFQYSPFIDFQAWFLDKSYGLFPFLCHPTCGRWISLKLFYSYRFVHPEINHDIVELPKPFDNWRYICEFYDNIRTVTFTNPLRDLKINYKDKIYLYN
jgi:hypothetical protein